MAWLHSRLPKVREDPAHNAAILAHGYAGSFPDFRQTPAGATFMRRLSSYIKRRTEIPGQIDSQHEYGYCYATPEMAQNDEMRYVAG